MTVVLNTPATGFTTGSGSGSGSGSGDLLGDAGYDVVLIAGQSNAVNMDAAGLDQYLDWGHDRIFQWSPDGGLKTVGGVPAGQPVYANRLLKAEDPLRFPAVAGQAGYEDLWGASPGSHFARNFLVDTQVNRTIVLVPAAVAGTGLVNSSWQSTVPVGALFTQAVTAATACVNALSGARLSAIVWLQGENEAQNLGVTPAQYESALDAMFGAFRSQIPTGADASVFVLQMNPEWIAADTNQADEIDIVHRETPLRLANSWFILGPTGQAKVGDGIHYTAEGGRIHGKRVAEKAKYLNLLQAGAALTAPYGLTSFGPVLTWTVPDSDAPLYQIEYRAAGSSDPWTEITYSAGEHALPGEELSYTFAEEVSGTIEVRIAGLRFEGIGPYSDVFEMTFLVIPQPWVEFDIQGLAETNGQAVASIDSIGTDVTAWTAPGGAEPVVSIVNTKKALDTTNVKYFVGPVLPAGSYTLFVLVRHTNFSTSGGYLFPTDSLVGWGLWRVGDGLTTASLAHDGNGAQVTGPMMSAGQWYVLAATYDADQVSDTDRLKLYINGVFSAAATVDNTVNVGTATGFNRVFSATTVGNTGTYGAVKIWTEVLSAGQIAQETADAAAFFGVSL